jgi:hypothetical protein
MSMLSLAAFAGWHHKLHASICAADLKGGTWGDPAMALNLEAQAIVFSLGAAALFGVAFALSKAPTPVSVRLFRFLAAAVLLFGVLSIASVALPLQSLFPCTR